MFSNNPILPQQDTPFLVDLHIKQLKRQVNNSFLELGRLLKQVRDEKLYKELDYETFESYLAQPELSFDRSSVYKFIKIYETFILGYNVSPERLSEIEWTKLDVVIPKLTNKNLEDVLTDAQQLSRSDLKEKYLITIYKLPVDKEIIKCPNCGFLFSKEDVI